MYVTGKVIDYKKANRKLLFVSHGEVKGKGKQSRRFGGSAERATNLWCFSWKGKLSLEWAAGYTIPPCIPRRYGDNAAGTVPRSLTMVKAFIILCLVLLR